MRRAHSTTMNVSFVTTEASETEALGERLGSIVTKGDTLCLVGDLGSGKTTLVRGLHRAMGCGGRVRSPSFTTLAVHAGPLPLHHFDFHRYARVTPGLLDEIGEWLPGDGVAAVEWADRLGAAAPTPRLEVSIREIEPGGARRAIELSGVGGDWPERLRALRERG